MLGGAIAFALGCSWSSCLSDNAVTPLIAHSMGEQTVMVATLVVAQPARAWRRISGRNGTNGPWLAATALLEHHAKLAEISLRI